jgi:hypothetical protein
MIEIIVEVENDFSNKREILISILYKKRNEGKIQGGVYFYKKERELHFLLDYQEDLKSFLEILDRIFGFSKVVSIGYLFQPRAIYERLI